MKETTLLLAAAADAAKRTLEDEGFETVSFWLGDPVEGPGFLVATKDDARSIRLVTLVVLEKGEVPDLEALRPEAERAMLEWFVGHDLEVDARVVFDLSAASLGEDGTRTIRVRYVHDFLGTTPATA